MTSSTISWHDTWKIFKITQDLLELCDPESGLCDPKSGLYGPDSPIHWIRLAGSLLEWIRRIRRVRQIFDYK